MPPLVSFGGVLTDAHSNPLTGVVGVTFAFYKESQSGVALWVETQNVYPDKTGRYTVLLGSTTSTGLPSELFVSGEARWLGVQVQGQAEQPRTSLLSVPYALKAADAQTIGGLPPSAFVLAAPPASISAGATTATAGAQPLAVGAIPVTTAGGTANTIAKWDATADITNSQIFDNGTNVGIGTLTPAAKLDVKGTAAVRGLFTLPSVGTATATTGYTSQPLKMTASVFNSGTAKAIAQNFQLQAEPAGNDTSSTSGTLNLLFSTGTNKLAETGLQIASNGQITFVAGQTFPGTGNGSVTSVGLTAPSTDFLVTGSPVTSIGTLGLGWLVAPDFNNTPNAIVKRDSSGNFSAGTINAATGFNLGGYSFALGSYSLGNAFLGFAGNSTMTGTYNTGGGFQALNANTTGNYNMAIGNYALHANTTGVGNTASGSDALYSNTVGSSNTASGYQALGANTTGFYNTATGQGALAAAAAGNSNTATGQAALQSNLSGSYNTATGADALFSSTGGYNTADGYQALYSTNTGINNTASGFNSLYLNTTGSGNTASGYEALENNTTGSNNTAVGNNAGPDINSPNLANATAIGYNAVVSQSNTLVLGGTGSNAVNVGIGTAKPAYTLDVQGGGRFTQPILFASSQTFPGTGTITGVTSGTGLTGGGNSGSVTLSVDTTKVVIGVAAGTDLTGGGTGGVQTLNLDTTKVPQLATANTFTGSQVVNGNLSATGVVTGSSFQIGSNLFAFGSYGTGNSFLGFAGGATTTGGGNTASGVLALRSNTSGFNNTATGYSALTNNTGSWNTATGSGALLYTNSGTGNTGTGFDALEYNTTGSNNTADGYQALSNVDSIFATGSYNTAIGYQALAYNTTGSYNTAIGGGAVPFNATGSYNTGLGWGAGPEVGLPGLINATAIGANAVVGQSNALVLGGTGPNQVNVGIGTTTPSASILTIGQGLGFPLADGWATYSSRRWKTNIHTLHGALEKVEQLRGVSYDVRANGKHEVGVIAEEVGAVIPEVVSWEKNGMYAQGVDYSRLTALLIEATKEQQQEIQHQQAALRMQAAAIRDLKSELRATRQTLQKVKAQVAAALPALVVAK